MAAPTLAELRTDVRDHLDEATATFWSDAELARWINEALREIARRGETLMDVRSYTVEADREAYPFPDDMLRIYRIEYRRSASYIYELEYQAMRDMESIWYFSRGVSGSLPRWWTAFGTPGQGTNQLYIFPIASETIVDGMRVFYYKLPRKLITDDDRAEIGAGWEDLVPLYVEINARRKEAQDGRWREAKELFDSKLNDMLDVTRQPTDQQTFITGQGNGLYALGDGGWDW